MKKLIMMEDQKGLQESTAIIFGKRLQEFRKELKLTQKQMSEKLFVAESTYANWEQGRREPSLGLLVRLAQELGVTTDYLLTGETLDADPSSAPELLSISVRTEALVRLLSRTIK